MNHPSTSSSATLICNQETGAFPEAQCQECFVTVTTQRCLAEVVVGGMYVEGTNRLVCGTPTCDDCSGVKDKNSIVRCNDHSKPSALVGANFGDEDTILEDRMYDEKSLSSMTKPDLILLCQNMGVFKHKGMKLTKANLVYEILEWQCNKERKKIVSRAGNVETKVFPNSRDRVDYCVDVLTSAGVPMVSDKQAMRLFIHSHLLNNHMNTNAAMAAIVMEKFPTVTSDVTSTNGRTTPIYEQPVQSPPAALNKHELGRMLMCIFMSENAPAVSAIRDKDLEELGAMNDAPESEIASSTTTTLSSSSGKIVLYFKSCLYCFYFLLNSFLTSFLKLGNRETNLDMASDDEIALIQLNQGGSIPKGLGVSLQREELDAKRSGAYVDAWEKIGNSFNSDMIFAHPDPTHLLAGKVDPNHSTEIRRGRAGQAFKAAFSNLRSQYTLIFNRWSSSGKNGSEDKDGNMNLTDYDDPFDNLDQMAPFSNFSERSKGPIGPEILEFMHSYVSLFPSLAPFVLRLLPPGMGTSEGGVKIAKKRKKEKSKGGKSADKGVDMRAILKDAAAPTEDEVALVSTTLENGKFDQLKKLYELLKMYTDALEQEKAEKVREKITKLEGDLGLL